MRKILYKNRNNGKLANYINEDDKYIYFVIDGLQAQLNKSKWRDTYELVL